MCSNLFRALRPSSEGEKSLLQHELVPFITIITLAYLGASSWGDPAQQAEQDTRGCGGSTCRANKSRDASHCSGQDLRGQQLPTAWRSEPVLQKLRDNKSMLISRGVMPHRDTPSDPPRGQGRASCHFSPKVGSCANSRPSPQPGPAREPQGRLLGHRSDVCQPLLRAGVWSLFHSRFLCAGVVFRGTTPTGKSPLKAILTQRRAHPSTG